MMIRARWTLALLAVLTLAACGDDPVAPELDVTGPDLLRVLVNTDRGIGRAVTIAETIAEPDYHICRLVLEEPLADGAAYGFLCEIIEGREAPAWAWFYISGVPAPVLHLMPRLQEDGWDDCELYRQVGAPGEETYTVFACTE